MGDGWGVPPLVGLRMMGERSGSNPGPRTIVWGYWYLMFCNPSDVISLHGAKNFEVKNLIKIIMGFWNWLKHYFFKSKKSLKNQIPKDEKEKAVQYLIDHIPADILNDFLKSPHKYLIDHHGFGMYIRNLLRQGGFNWGPHTLDNNWNGLICKVAKKKGGFKVIKQKRRYCDICGANITCPYCNGWGVLEGSTDLPCEFCNKTGRHFRHKCRQKGNGVLYKDINLKNFFSQWRE